MRTTRVYSNFIKINSKGSGGINGHARVMKQDFTSKCIGISLTFLIISALCSFTIAGMIIGSIVSLFVNVVERKW